MIETKASRHQGVEASSNRGIETLRERFAWSNQNRLASSPARSFTLIELIVVIGIIAVLFGLTVGVIAIVNRKSETRETENILKLLDQALIDWETASERQLSWWQDGYNLDGIANPNARYDINAVESGEEQMTDILKRFKATSSTQQVLAQINADYFVNTAPANQTPRLHVNDSWGKEIVVVHPGPLRTTAGTGTFVVDADGTIRTLQNTFSAASGTYEIHEGRFGACVNRRMCFVSAGPDNRFGNMHMDQAQSSLTPAQLKDIAEASDNVYSYPPVKDRAP